jgi:hypothetical protein
MGSGGGIDLGWPKGGASAEEILRRASKAEEKTSYEGEVNVYLQDLLADFNNRKQDQIDAHVITIEDALNKEDIGSLTLSFGGSIKKYTYVDGLSDVDVLAKVNDSLLTDKAPGDVLNYFAQKIKERLPLSAVITGTLAVTVKFSDGLEVQVLPAISAATGIRIADSDGKSWSNVINPEKFAEKLTNVNKNNNNGVVPVIKLYKAINKQLPEDAQLTGYHIESIAINAFRYYEGDKSRKAMLMHLCKFASEAVLEPIKDHTGQSINVDDKLGAAGSYERQKVSANIKREANKMKLADSEASVQGWKELFGE